MLASDARLRASLAFSIPTAMHQPVPSLCHVVSCSLLHLPAGLSRGLPVCLRTCLRYARAHCNASTSAHQHKSACRGQPAAIATPQNLNPNARASRTVPSRHCEGDSHSSYVPTVDEYTAAAKARLFKLYPANLTEDLAELLQQASQPPAVPRHPDPPPPSDAPFLRAPARGLGIRAAVEKGMAEGRGVDIAGGTHSWDEDVLAVWLSRFHLHM